MLWPQWGPACSYWVASEPSRWAREKQKITLSFTYWILVCPQYCQSAAYLSLRTEHIKYPGANNAPPSGPPTSLGRTSSATAQSVNSQGPSTIRATSPMGDQGLDTDDLRRAISPSSIRSVPNGSASQGIDNSLRGKPPLRPARDDSEEYEVGGSNPSIITGERAVSPEQKRAKSPNALKMAGKRGSDECSKIRTWHA